MLKKNIPFLLFQIFICFKLTAQNISLETKGSLPIAESSGIETVNHNTFWTHNDSGGQPELYEIDTLGNLLRTLSISNATNVDWEDITADDKGRIFIGDFGNNANTRTDLKIYLIDNPDSIITTSTNAQKINFTLSDQTTFPPSNANLNFDVEAMVWFDDSLYLFSKNRSIPFNGYTKYYQLPAIAGTYVAELVDSFYAGSGSAWDYQITAADVNPDKKQLFLLSHSKAWIFSSFNSSDFFSGNMQQLNFSFDSQKEGISYANDSVMYITDEYGSGNGGFLYKVIFSPNITNINIGLFVNPICVFPNPILTQFTVKGLGIFKSQNITLQLINQIGEVVFNTNIKNNLLETTVMLPKNIANGIYVLRLFSVSEQFNKQISISLN